MSFPTYEPDDDGRAIARIAHDHFGGFEQLFAHHGWPERGADMMRKVQARVAETYGSVRAFEERYSEWPQITSEPLHIRRRLRELRKLIRIVDDPRTDAGLYSEARQFFLDIINNLAGQRPENSDDIRAGMIDLLANLNRPDLPDKGLSKMAPKWVWPVVFKGPSDGKGKPGDYGAEFSALKIFGYTVGKAEGWPVHKRRSFLTDFMEMELPEIVEEYFPDEYGMPLTTTRLRKMANVIASNAGRFYRNDPIKYAVAISDWEDDLEFLKEKYYEGEKLKFQPWPETH